MASESQSCSDDMLTSHRSYVNTVYGTNYQYSSDNMKKKDKKRLIIASVLCLMFMIAEAIGGILSNSLALMTDAAHLLTDFGAFLVSLTSLFIAGKKRTRTMTFGYHRAEVIGALVSILSIWLLTGILFYAAIQRFITLNFEIDATIMLIVAAIGMFANIVLAIVLLFPDTFKNNGNIEKNSVHNRRGIALRSAFIHVLGDFVHTAGVFVASLVIYFYPKLKIADPIITIVFSIIILVTTLTILKDIMLVLMEGVPKHISLTEVHNVLFSIPEISHIHDLRMWSLTLEKVALSAHVVIKSGTNSNEILKKATALINENINDIFEITLQIEEELEENL
ncbi:proton-coupled zinc antiporter SLC30A2-like [Argiope bruennichi]|uniref:Zinc transporter 2 like protein n=1 Tax=Argiope bruennichi TaxID=94029 RepID=A0A8T0E9B6_ARGBR|nr:proton-coupled zinc antiporter SLC30A2-like [Argiope bruennichi]KAF8767041.1 Zinc transporter 2 like protein [Argiope bruennichi]